MVWRPVNQTRAPWPSARYKPAAQNRKQEELGALCRRGFVAWIPGNQSPPTEPKLLLVAPAHASPLMRPPQPSECVGFEALEITTQACVSTE